MQQASVVSASVDVERKPGVRLLRAKQHKPSKAHHKKKPAIDLEVAFDQEIASGSYKCRIMRNIRVRMRDGVSLTCDVWLPPVVGPEEEQSTTVYPTLLTRTPYSKSKPHDRARVYFWVRQGYAYVVQDCRGRYCSEGTFYKYVREHHDGFDTVAWVSQQPWCNGNVGTRGRSYLTHVQVAMSTQSPPALACMFWDKGGFFNAFTSGVRQGGALEFRQWVWAFRHAKKGKEALSSPAIAKALNAQDLADWLSEEYPFTPDHSPVMLAPSYSEFIFDLSMRSQWDADYWAQIGLNIEDRVDEVADVPTIIWSGWYDIYARSSVELFNYLRPHRNSMIRLIMGPWRHKGDTDVVGEVDFGCQARAGKPTSAPVGLRHVQRELFDMVLKGRSLTEERKHVGKELADQDPYFGLRNKRLSLQKNTDPVWYFRLGGNDCRMTERGHLNMGGTWLTSTQFPPKGTTYVRYFLQSDFTISVDRPKPGKSKLISQKAQQQQQQQQQQQSGEGKTQGKGIIDIRSGSNGNCNITTTAAKKLSADDARKMQRSERVRQALGAAGRATSKLQGVTYEFDPSVPVPTIGGNIFEYEEGDVRVLYPGAYDQREREEHVLEPYENGHYKPLCEREDVISWRSAPLPESLDVTGVVTAKLYVASTAVDTDFTVKVVCEVPPNEDYPGGFAMNVTHGICRARYRESPSQTEPRPLKHSYVYAIEVQCYPTAMLFAPGHVLRIDISSSNFPHFDINLNTGAEFGESREWRVAYNTIFFDPKYASHVVLPVVPPAAAKCPFPNPHAVYSGAELTKKSRRRKGKVSPSISPRIKPSGTTQPTPVDLMSVEELRMECEMSRARLHEYKLKIWAMRKELKQLREGKIKASAKITSLGSEVARLAWEMELTHSRHRVHTQLLQARVQQNEVQLSELESELESALEEEGDESESSGSSDESDEATDSESESLSARRRRRARPKPVFKEEYDDAHADESESDD